MFIKIFLVDVLHDIKSWPHITHTESQTHRQEKYTAVTYTSMGIVYLLRVSGNASDIIVAIRNVNEMTCSAHIIKFIDLKAMEASADTPKAKMLVQ